MLNIFQIVLTVVFAIIFGFLAVLVGVGGGLFYVPYLIFVLDVGIAATLTSSLAILFTATSGSIKYSKLKYIDYKIGLIFVAVAIPGSVIGSYAAETILVDTSILKTLFACLLIGIASIKLALLKFGKRQGSQKRRSYPFVRINRKLATNDGKIFHYDAEIGFGVIFSFLGGLLAGVLGIGGGLIFVPILSSLAGLPTPIAIATSTFMIVIVTIFVLVTRFIFFSGGDISVIVTWGAIIGISSIIGGYIGASKISKTDSKKIIAFFWVIALVSGLKIFFDVYVLNI